MSELNEALELSPQARGWLHDLQLKQILKNTLEEEIDILKESIKAELLDNPIGSINGQPVVTWKPVTSLRFDQKIAKELIDPALFSRCQKENTVKVFRLVEGTL